MSREMLGDQDFIGAAEFVFQTTVRAKRSNQPGALASTAATAKAKKADLVARIRAVTKKQPEVMVKVSGSAKGRSHIKEHLDYITRNGKLDAEREGGDMLRGVPDVREVAGEWWALRGDARPSNARDTINLVLSMPRGTDPEKLRQAVRSFAHSEFEGLHDYVMVIHTQDTDPSGKTEQPHAHLTVKTVGHDGQHLNPRKDDLQRWREVFAQALVARGVEAAATPRRARGVVRKAENQIVRNIRTDPRKHRTPRVNVWKVQQALKIVQSGSPLEESNEPWFDATRQRQRKIRASWNRIAAALDADGKPALAVQVKDFVANMPSMESERARLVRQAQDALRKTLEAKPDDRAR